MSASKPTSVLIFLGACLAFAEALAGVAGKLDNRLCGVWVLGFGTFNLVLVLLTLLYMYRRNPEFLIAERRDLVPLRVIEGILAREENSELLREVIPKID